MVPEKIKRNLMLAGLALILLVLIIFMIGEVYVAFFVRRDLFYLFRGFGRDGFSTELLVFLSILVIGYEYFTKRLFDRLPPANPGIPMPGSVSDPVSPGRQQRDFISPALANWGTAIFISILLIGFTHIIFKSVPLTIATIGIIAVCLVIVRLLAPPQIWSYVFFLAVISVLLPFSFFGAYLIAPGFTPAGLLTQIFANPLPLMYAAFILLIPVYAWLSVFGIPFFRPLTDTDLEELVEEEIILSHPFEQAFDLCRKSILLLPNNQINTADPVFGTLSASVSPGWGRASSVSFVLERIDDGKTRVKIRAISPVPSGDDKTRKRTWVNRKYVKILVSYLQWQ